MAALLNFAGAFISFKVAATVAKGIVDPDGITLKILLAGLVGAITWNLVTWYLGLPSSSSHALIGGVMGSAIAAQGWNVVQWSGLWRSAEAVADRAVRRPRRRVRPDDRDHLADREALAEQGRSRLPFRPALPGGFVALAHGTNDAQKTMGIIALALVSPGHLSSDSRGRRPG